MKNSALKIIAALLMGSSFFFASCGGDTASTHSQPEATQGDNVNLDPIIDSTELELDTTRTDTANDLN